MVSNYQKLLVSVRRVITLDVVVSELGYTMTPITVIRWSRRQRLARRGWSTDLNARRSPRCRHTPCSSTASGTATEIRGRTLADHIPRRRHYNQLYRSPAFVSRVRCGDEEERGGKEGGKK